MSNNLLSPDSRVGRLLREGSSVGIGQVFSVVARLLGLRLITELAAPTTYGEVVLLIGILALGRDVFCTPILTATLRFFPDAAAQGRTRELRNLVARLLKRCTLFSGALLLAGAGVWIFFSDAEVSVWAFVLLAVLLALDVQRMFETNLLNAERRQAAFSAWGALDAWGRALGAVGLILMFGPSAVVIVLGYTVGAGVVNLIMRLAVVKPPDEPAEADASWAATTRGPMLRYAAPLVPLATLGWITTLGDRYVLAALASAQEVGIYAAAFGVASMPFVFVASTIALTLRPILFDAFAARDTRKKRQTLLLWLSLLLAAFIPGMILVDVLSGPIVRLLLGEAFWDAAPLLVWIAAASAVQGVQQVFSNVIYAEGRTPLLMVAHGAAAIVALGLFALLIPEYGALGAALSILGSRIVAFAVTFWISRSYV